jgi:CRP/FNR family transcriptional regulator, dissimilatory nitrate respiration regulator
MGRSLRFIRQISYDLDHMKNIVLPPTLKTLLPPEIQGECEAGLIKKQDRVFLAGAMPVWMFYVISGEVTLERNGVHGESVVLQRTRQGFISEASLKVARYHCDAVAISDTHVIKVPVKALTKSLDQDPAFASRWINMLNSEVRRLRLHLERLNMKSIRDRLIHLIETEGKDGKFPIPSGLKTLAGELGVTHEALYRAIAALQSEGLLKKEDGRLILKLD